MNPIQTPPTPDTSSGLIVYGADWCEDTRRTRRLLRRLGVVHRYRNVDEDLDALERAAELNRGVRRTPVVTLIDDVLVEPTNQAMTNALVHHGVLTREVALERLHVQNIGDLERCARVSAGLLLLALKRQAPKGLRGALGVTGTSLLLTGMAGWCPVFHTKGVSSLNGPIDRPDESERSGWLARVRNARSRSIPGEHQDHEAYDDAGADTMSATASVDGAADGTAEGTAYVTVEGNSDRTVGRTANGIDRTDATDTTGNAGAGAGLHSHAGSGNVLRRGTGAGSGFESGAGGQSGRRGAPRLTLIEPDRPS